MDVVIAPEGLGAERVGVGDRHLVDQCAAIVEDDLNARAEGFIVGVQRVIAPGPFRVLAGLDFVPEPHGFGAVGAFGGVGGFVIPDTILQGDREDIHDGMIQRLAAGFGVHFLRVVGAGADDVMGVVRGVDDDALDGLDVRDALAHSEGEVDQRLGLVFGGMFLGVAVQDRALGLAGGGQRHVV